MNDDAPGLPPTGRELELFLAETRSEVLRQLPPRPKRLSLSLAGGAILGLAVLALGTAGGAVATGFLNSGQPVNGEASFLLDIPDFEATHLAVTVTCLSAGEFTANVQGLPDSAITMSCDADDVGHSASSTFAIENPAEHRRITVVADPGTEYSIDEDYVAWSDGGYPKNRAGETYGLVKDQLSDAPDLSFVIGEDARGAPVQGYVRTDETRIPQGLAESGGYIEWLDEFNARYPNGKRLPLFSSDGVTVVGAFYLFH